MRARVAGECPPRGGAQQPTKVAMALSTVGMRAMTCIVASALVLAGSSSRLSAQPPFVTRIASEPDVQGARRVVNAWLEGQMLQRGVAGVAVRVVGYPE